jgi:formylmethanofuran dehydrogenase subunit E
MSDKEFKVGDKIVCHTKCVMKHSGLISTTVGKIYTILLSEKYKEDNRIIIDDQNEAHYFSNTWKKYFRSLRKEKLNRLKDISDGQEQV